MIKPKTTVESMSAYSVDLFKPEYKFKLDENENLWGPSPKVIAALSSINEESVRFYPCYGKLLERLAKYNNLSENCFLNTNGADEAINVIFSTYLNAGDKVLTVKPSFSMPKIYAQICGANYIEIPYTTKWSFPEKEFLEKIEENPDIKIVHLTTPNNPTGDCISRATIEKIIEKVKNGIVVVDETYANYFDKFNTDLAQKYDNVFIVRSFSKDFALAGLRIGYIISNPDNIVHLNKVRSPYSTNALAMRAAIAALDDSDYFAEVSVEIKKVKTELENMLKKLGFGVYDTEANFILVDMGEKSEFVYNSLLRNSIKIRRFDNNEFLKNTFRIGIPTLGGLDAIRNVFANITKDIIIFDMDGVLFDTSGSYRQAIKDTYEFFSHESVTFEEIQKAKNLGGLNNDWDLTEYLLQRKNINIEKEKIIDKFQGFYWDNGNGYISKETLLIDKSVLEKLSNKYNLAIFTGRPRTEAIFSLKLHDILKYFNVVVTMNDLPSDRQKPYPDGIELIKQRLFCNDIFYCGDTCDDILCAVAAKVHSVGILPPQDKSSTLKENMMNKGAERVFDNINDIVKILECKNA